MNLSEIKNLLKRKSFEDIKSNILEELKNHKQKAVTEDNQALAKEIWCLEQIYKVKSFYIKAFNNMKCGNFKEAWYLLDRSDIELSFLRRHFDYSYSNNEYDLFFIEKYIKKFQKLFPYDFFFSRETIESDFTCSICGSSMGLRGGCEHIVGEIYNGEMCCRVVNKIEFLGISIVKNPFDKYTIPEIEGVFYNYYMLENLVANLDTAFDGWDPEIIEEK